MAVMAGQPIELTVWDAQRKRARRLAEKQAVVEYRPPYNAASLGLPEERFLGQVVQVAVSESPEWGPMVVLGYGPRKKDNQVKPFTYHRAVPVALVKEVTVNG